MRPLPNLSDLFWHDTHERLVALIARFTYHLYGQSMGEQSAYISHTSLLLISDTLHASGGYHTHSQSVLAFGAMFLLQRLKYAHPGVQLPDFAHADDYFMASLAVAQKYILEYTGRNIHLVHAAAGRYTITRLNALERTLLRWLDYDVSMDLEQLVVFVQFALANYSCMPVYISKAGLVAAVEEGCWPYFGEQLLVTRVQTIPFYANDCICSCCVEPCDNFLATLALVFPSPALSQSNR